MTQDRHRTILRASLQGAIIIVIGVAVHSVRNHEKQSSNIITPERDSRQDIPAELGPASEKGKTRNQPNRGLTSPLYEPYDVDGEISERLLQLAGVSIERRAELKDIVEESRERVKIAMASKVEIRSNQDGTKEVFIPPLGRLSNEIVSDLEENIAKTFGKGAARILVPYFTSPSYLAGFGQYELHAQQSYRLAPSDGSATTLEIKFQVVDPADKRIIAQHSVGKKKRLRLYVDELLENNIAAGEWNQPSR